MSQKTVYVAFPSSEKLHQTTDGFIHRMNEGAKYPEPAVVEAIMSDFLDEALRAFFLAPTDLLGLSASMTRIVHLTSDTISGATHVVVKRASKKMDIKQNREAAKYMDSIRMQANDADGNLTWFVAFPISDHMASHAQSAIELAEAGEYEQARPRLTAFLHELTDVALHWYFEEPMKLLGFGPVMRKICSVAVETTRKASHGLINKVFTKLDDQQLTEAARYMDSLLVEGPKVDI